MKTVTASEANRNFSKLLREVAGGEEVTVTACGRTVARIVPCVREMEQREEARRALLSRLSKQKTLGRKIDWTRSELYDD